MIKRINLKSANVARSNTIRDINRQIVLNYIREEGPVSRAELARLTALQRSTVSLIVDELLKGDLIEEVYGESSGGRPPQLLSLRTAHAVALGIDIGKKRTIVGSSDLAGRVLEQEEFPTDRDLGKTMDRIIDSARRFIHKSGGSIDGIGLSVPGLVEPVKGTVLHIPHLDWHGPDITGRLSTLTGLPVRAENDANAAALAELWFGRPEISEVRDFITVLIDNGIGTGIVFDGQIYRGKDGVAGEFGHMTIGEGAPISCSAGRFDCWESFASERTALARFSKLKGKTNGKSNGNGNGVTFVQLIDLAFAGDKNALAALKETARYIGVGISTLIQGLSPDVTIIAGTIVRAWPLIADEVRGAADAAICQGFPSGNIMPSTLGPYPTLMGALSLVLANKFASISIH
jgi:predicted NBD/HSP70 family sugar kinase